MLSLLLPMMALTIVTSCGKDDVITPNKGNDIQQDHEIVVTIDVNGNADGGHRFSRIDETNFYIDEIKYTAKDGNLVVSGYDPIFFKGAAKIISKLVYNGLTLNVTSISDNAFKNCKVLTSVIISKGISNIGYSAFSGCSNLTSINIPNSMTNIGFYAFCECGGLTSINIPNNVTDIGGYTFYGCSGLTSINIPNSVADEIGDYAFYGCSGLTSINIPPKVTRIGKGTFDKCHLKNVYCYALNPPSTYIEYDFEGIEDPEDPWNLTWTEELVDLSFDTSYTKENTTLHVPAGSLETYKTTFPWSSFKEIVAIPDN